jgi:neutral ceramidase
MSFKRREFLKRTLLLGAPPAMVTSAFRRPASEVGVAQAGYAEADITPELGMEQPGGYGKAYLTRFHDPCKVRAAVFEAAGKRVALVGVDAGSVPRVLVAASRRRIRGRCGIDEQAVLIGASHSHSSGPVSGVMPGSYDHASELVRKLAYEHSTCIDLRYLKRVEDQIVDAVCRASDSRAEARCGFGFGHEDKAAFNRRFRMKNGLTFTHPGQGNPDILEPAGPIDPQVGVIGTWNREGKLIGCVVNYACHATTSPPGISANWIYYLEKTIRGILGPDVVVVFLQGDAGDVTQVDNLSPYRRPSGDEWARLVGGRVGAEAVKVLLSVPAGEFAPLDAATQTLRIRRRAPSRERVHRCLDLVRKDPKEVGHTEWTFAKEIVLLDALLQKEPAAETEVQAVQVGPAVFIANSAEMFVEYGLDLKKRCAFPFTFPVAYANDDTGYVPTEEALGPRGGGYETRLTSYSNLEVTAGRQMNEAGLALAARMRPGTPPEFDRAEPFRPEPGGIGSQPWSYGNVPPELS